LNQKKKWQNQLHYFYLRQNFNLKKIIYICVITGVYGFVNFGHRPWGYSDHFCKKAGKNLEKKIISKRIIKKKREKPGVGQKYEINYA
jgi:hypothetical protein